jgi:hypothetical protein
VRFKVVVRTRGKGRVTSIAIGLPPGSAGIPAGVCISRQLESHPMIARFVCLAYFVVAQLRSRSIAFSEFHDFSLWILFGIGFETGEG